MSTSKSEGVMVGVKVCLPGGNSATMRTPESKLKSRSPPYTKVEGGERLLHTALLSPGNQFSE